MTIIKRYYQRYNMLALCVLVGLFGFTLLFNSCGNRTATAQTSGDTVQLDYAKYLQLICHKGYTEAVVLNPWKQGGELHRYLLVPKGSEGDEVAKKLADQKTAITVTTPCDILRTPLTKSIITTSAHCQLLYELGCQQAIAGVCDLEYILIPDVQKRTSHKSRPYISNCGSGMQPDIERIMSLRPDALLLSPFENSGGYGKLSALKIPIIEAADYMETSPLGRSEWIKFYGLLYGSEKATSLFSGIEKSYLHLKAFAAKLPLGYSILTERKTGSVWYVSGGRSTIGTLLRDAHARYLFADDTHSGSLPMSPEQILAKADEVDVWATKYWGDHPLSHAELLQEYPGYSQLKAMKTGRVFQASTSSQPYFEQTCFHPERLLREFIILSHPETTRSLGALRYYQALSR